MVKKMGAKKPAEATVKVTGPQDLVEEIVEFLEGEFYATRSSDMREGDRGYVYIFVKVLGVRG